MQRRTPLIRAVGPQISSGLQPDVHNVLSLLWEAAANVTFYATKVRRRVPPSEMYNGTGGTNGPTRALSQQQGTNGTRWVWSSHGPVVRRWYGPASELIHNFGADYQANATSTALATMIDFTHFGDWTVLNCGKGLAKLYKHGTGLGDYTDAPTDVVAFQKKLNFMMAFGHGGRGTQLSWSAADDIEDWTPTTSNEAGDLFIEDFDTPIRAICRLGSATAVYSEDQLAMVQYISAPYYFGQRVALDGIGCVGKKAVAGDGQRNFGVSRNGIWMTDGISFKYIDVGLLRDYLQDNVNWDQASKVFVCRNDYRGTFEFFFPMGANLECSEGWSYDPMTGGWSLLPAFTAKDERRLFPRPIAGNSGGYVYLDEADKTGVGALTLRSKPMLIQVSDGTNITDGHIVARLDEVQIFARVAVNVEFRVGSLMNSGDTPVWSGWKPVPQDSSTISVDDLTVDGVYHVIDFRSTANNWDLDLQGFQLFGTPDGTKRSSQ